MISDKKLFNDSVVVASLVLLAVVVGAEEMFEDEQGGPDDADNFGAINTTSESAPTQIGFIIAILIALLPLVFCGPLILCYLSCHEDEEKAPEGGDAAAPSGFTITTAGTTRTRLARSRPPHQRIFPSCFMFPEADYFNQFMNWTHFVPDEGPYYDEEDIGRITGRKKQYGTIMPSGAEIAEESTDRSTDDSSNGCYVEQKREEQEDDDSVKAGGLLNTTV